MGEQVTSGTRTVDSARLYLATLDEGRDGATRHGASDRWDWGVTAETLARAQDRESQADRLVRQMSDEERAELWVGDGPEQALLRRVVRRMEKLAAARARDYREKWEQHSEQASPDEWAVYARAAR